MPHINFSFPLTGALVPLTFTAWGTFDYADAEQNSAHTPAKCTLTPSAGNPLTFDIDLSRNDGIWTSLVSGLANNMVYTIDAYYSRKNMPGVKQHAPQEDTIRATLNLVPVPRPPAYEPPPILLAALPPDGAGARAGGPVGVPGAACCHPYVATRFGTYPFPTCAKIQKAQAIVRKRRNTPAGPVLPVPGAYVSVHPVLAAFGSWTTLIPVPADAAPAGPLYVADIVFLDRDGRIVVDPVTVAVHV